MKASAQVYVSQIDWGSLDEGRPPQFPFTFSPEFLTGIRSVSIATRAGPKARNKAVFSFFNNFGTTVLRKAVFGSWCEMHIDFKGSHTTLTKSQAQQATKSTEWQFLFAKGGWTTTSDSSHSGTVDKDVSYQTSSKSCAGYTQINVCDPKDAGKTTQPVLTSAQGIPIWKIPIPG